MGKFKHGRCNTPEYNSWKAMLARCTNPRADWYDAYGGRGITICSAWSDSFAAFLGDMGERPAGATLDRIDNSGNYEPGNCRWATRAEQRSNQRPPRKLQGTSRFRGVSWNTRQRKWKATCTVNGKTVYLGMYASEEAAAAGRQSRLGAQPGAI